MAETNGLLNRRTGKSGTEGSNPSVSAKSMFAQIRIRPERLGFIKCFGMQRPRPLVVIPPNPCLKLAMATARAVEQCDWQIVIQSPSA